MIWVFQYGQIHFIRFALSIFMIYAGTVENPQKHNLETHIHDEIWQQELKVPVEELLLGGGTRLDRF
jgi:hypothetical protein